MTMEAIFRKWDLLSDIESDGWKVFDWVDGKLVGEFYDITGEADYPSEFWHAYEVGNAWYDSTDEELCLDNYHPEEAETYRSGFHYYMRRQDALEAADALCQAVVKIRVRKRTAIGSQFGRMTGVAQEMRLVKIVAGESLSSEARQRAIEEDPDTVFGRTE